MKRYMVGAVSARTGDEMSGPALLVAGLAVTGSPVLASWLLAGLTASAAVGGPLLGVLLDRARRPGAVLARCLAGYAAGLALVAWGLGRLPGPALVAAAFATGLLGPALTGGWTGQLPLVSGGIPAARAAWLDAMSYNVAGLAGPALVGVLAAWGGGTAAVPAAVVLLAAAVPAARSLPTRPAQATAARAAGVWAELAAGFAVIVGNPALRRATVSSMVSCAGLAMLVVSAPVLGADLAGDAGRGALLLAAFAAAGLAANALLAWAAGHRSRRDGRWEAVMLWATVLLGAGTALAAVAGTFAVAVAAAVVAGAGEGPQLTALFSVRHREAPERLRSQVFTTGASLKVTSFALGSALAGVLAAPSPQSALAAGAALQAVAAALLVIRRFR
ncbi:MFS transporter [Nonomuraea pusilla]|uniref:MFS transporter n=1 Tax=Nonomuraea pusilla TaxID=46177 RepID=UPI00331C6A06